ncbi:unnamed protein product [Diabrotica balteata]|uniref:MD-2-related lipid-recognition domain-containing protein n=1 Tax=Diabrotica balteata TaxID=107213 RepID=A0A9P0DWE0_DIABA|nr:unnamed protein product [Diabrotica balteata]
MGSKKVVISVVYLILVLGSETGQIVKIELTDSEGGDRFPIKQGTNPSILVTFKSNTYSKTLNAVAIGTVGSNKGKYNLRNPNACELGVTCPINSGNTYNYTLNLFVIKSYPLVKIDLELHLKDENDKDVICALIPVEIVP